MMDRISGGKFKCVYSPQVIEGNCNRGTFKTYPIFSGNSFGG